MIMHADPAPTPPPRAPSAASNPGDIPHGHAGRRAGKLRTLGVMLVAGVLAGLAGGLLVDRLFHGTQGFLEFHSAFLKERQAKGLSNTPEEVANFVVEKRRLHKLDVAMSVGLVGLIYGVLFGLGRGVSTGFSRSALSGTAWGAVVGSLLGAAGGYAAGSLDYWFEDHQRLDPMYQAMIKHALSWVGVAVGVGLTGVLPVRRPGRIAFEILPTIAAAVVAGLIFVPVSAILFPNSLAEISIPLGTGNRLLWTCLPAILMPLAGCMHSNPTPPARGPCEEGGCVRSEI